MTDRFATGDEAARNAARAAAVEAAFLRNGGAAVAWEGIWGIGAPCCLSGTVAPAYLLAIGASKTLVQIVTVSFSLATCLQLLSTRLIRGDARRLQIFAVWSLFCCTWLAYGIAATLFWPHLHRHLWRAVFVAMCLVLAVAMNLGSAPFGEMLLENTPKTSRGRLSSVRFFALGVCGLAGVSLAAWLMRQWPAPANFHRSFIVGSGIMLISCLTLLMIKDVAQTHRITPETEPPGRHIFRELLQSFNFRVFLVFYGLLATAQTLAPLFIGYGTDILHMPPSQVARFSGAFFVGFIVVATALAPLADRYGFRLIAILAALLLASAYLIPVFLPASSWAVVVAYSFSSGSVALTLLVVGNLGHELVPDLKPAVIIATGSAAVMPLGLCVAPLGGRLVDLHGSAGYLAVQILGAALALCAALGFALLVREPRTGEELYIRIRHV